MHERVAPIGPMMPKPPFKVISLFSGAMGLDLGLEKTGRFRIVACVEQAPASCATIRKNITNGHLCADLRVYETDIRDLDPLRVLNDVGFKPGELDLLVGGPPCQTFSTTGRRRTVADPRGTLLWQFLRFVEAMRPRFFLMENVRGLISAAIRHRPIARRPERGGPPLEPEEQAGSVLRLFASDVRRLSQPYHMDCFEVNAVNYGAPQLRERAIFIGNRFNAKLEFPDPTHGPSGRTAKSWATLRDAIGDLREREPQVLDFSPRKKRYLDMVPEGSNWRSLSQSFQRESMGKAWRAKGGRSGWWRRLTYDLPCPTLVTMPNHASTSLCHPTETRALSIREYARVQEFPDDWEFAGTLAEQYVQVGNAVPIRLGQVAGSVIAGAADAFKARGWRSLPTGPGDYRVVYVQSHVRTRRWYREGRTVLWDDEAREGDVRYPSPRTMRKARIMAPEPSASLFERDTPSFQAEPIG